MREMYKAIRTYFTTTYGLEFFDIPFHQVDWKRLKFESAHKFNPRFPNSTHLMKLETVKIYADLHLTKHYIPTTKLISVAY